MNQTKRILLLTTSLAEGGAEVVVKQLALALRSENYTVSVVSMLDPTAFVPELRAAGVSVCSLSMSRSGLNLPGISRLFSYIRAFRPDVIHAHMFHASMLARLMRVILGIPVVCTVHSEIECSHLKKSAQIRELLYRITDRASDCTTAVSHRVRDRYVTRKLVRDAQMPVVANGVDIERFRPESRGRVSLRSILGWSDSFVWLAVGRLEDPKDFSRLVRAFAPVHRQWPSAQLVIVGEGRLRRDIETTMNEFGLQDSVTLMGSRQDVPDLMNAADAFAISSEWEGCQLVLLEACATGKPVVATEVGAAPQIVVPNSTGFLVPPRDTGALAKAMCDLMKLPDRSRARMGEQARERIEQYFSLDRVHRQYLALYEQVSSASL